MAKKRLRSSANQSTAAKKPLRVESPAPAKKQVQELAKKRLRSSGNQSTAAKKPLQVASPAKKHATTAKKAVASTSKKKKQRVINTPPESLHDEEEEVETEEEEEEEENDPSSEPPPPPQTIEVTKTARKPLIQRVWSEEEEAALLQGLVDFKAETKKNPLEDLSGYYETVKGSINGKTCMQFKEKVRKLKMKYLREKMKKTSTNPHYLKCLELAKLIWETAHVKDDSVSDWFERLILSGAFRNMGLVDDEYAKSKWDLVSVENKKMLEDKWKLLDDDFERLAEKTKFLVEVCSVISEA